MFPAVNSIDWLQQRLPKPVADWIGRDYAQNERWMQEVGEPRKLAGETLSMGMSLLPAGRMTVPRPTGIRTYHGFRSVVDKPDIGKVGTGTDSGAMTGDEGWGFNTTTARPWAESYANRGMDTPGNVYQIEANVAPDRILDWSKPISEQSAFVRQKLAWPD